MLDNRAYVYNPEGVDPRRPDRHPEHNVINRGGRPATFVEIELKR